MIKMNKLMQEEVLKIKDIDNTFDFTGKLSVINPLIYKIQDGIFMKIDERDKETLETVNYYEYEELSEFEYSCSEFLIENYFEGITYEQSLRLALDIIEIWGYKLHALYPNDEFHIILAINLDEDFDKDVMIRYYKYRGEDSFHYNLDELDKYTFHAVLVNVIEANKDEDGDDEIESDKVLENE